MADADIKIKISKDSSSNLDGALANSERLANKLVSTIEGGIGSASAEAFGALSKIAGSSLGRAFGIAGAAAVALKKDLDFTLQSERIQQINNSFNALASAADLSAQALKEGLGEAARGLADEDEILQAANRALVQMGHNASVVTETMELARKATALFGGNLVQNFESLNDALASGNARALRQFGIIVDSERAYKSFAKEQGVSVDVLTEAGRKQAVMNAALDLARQKFSNVDESATQATQAHTRLGVALKDLQDTIATTLQQSGFFATALNTLAGAATSASTALKERFGAGVENVNFQTRTAEARVKNLEESLAHLTAVMNSAPSSAKDGFAQQIAKIKDDLALARIEADDARKAMQLLTATKGASDKSGSGSGAGDFINQQALAQKRAQAESTLNAFRQSLLAANEAYYSQNNDLTQRTVDLDAIAAEKRLQIAADYEARIQALKTQNAQTNALTQAQLNEAEILLESEKASRIAAIRDQSVIDYQSKLKSLNESFKAILVSGISNSIQAFTNALIKGENAFEAFGKAIFGMFGDMAIKLGEFFIQEGFARQFMESLSLGAGGGTIAAGVGLIALGTVLKSLAGGGGSSSGGSVGASLQSSAGTTNAIDTQNTRPTTAVTVNVQGNILDRRETGLYIADTLNEYFGASDGRLVVAS